MVPMDLAHGTISTYTNHNCRCKPCRAEARRVANEYRERLRAEGIPEDVAHGTKKAYVIYKCRCTPCTAWKMAAAWERRDQAREHVNKIKSNPCTDCGGTFPVVCMQFDHTGDDKEYNISSMVTCGYNIARIDVEIAKCELVCANCHAIRTDRRRREGTEMALATVGTQ